MGSNPISAIDKLPKVWYYGCMIMFRYQPGESFMDPEIPLALAFAKEIFPQSVVEVVAGECEEGAISIDDRLVLFAPDRPKPQGMWLIEERKNGVVGEQFWHPDYKECIQRAKEFGIS